MFKISAWILGTLLFLIGSIGFFLNWYSQFVYEIKAIEEESNGNTAEFEENKSKASSKSLKRRISLFQNIAFSGVIILLLILLFA